MEMVLNPNGQSERVNFSLEKEKYLFIDNRPLWDEVQQNESLEFEILLRSQASKSPKNEKKIVSIQNTAPPGPCNCPKSYVFKNLDELHVACKKKVECDNKAFSIRSVYLPNPSFRPDPPYVLVALEPSISLEPIINNVTPDLFREYVEKGGFKNFMRSNRSFVLRYCMREYLGDSLITDFSKGAMPPNFAGRYRTERFKRWLPILKAELELFKNPKVYALGNEAEKYLKKFKFPYQKIRENGQLKNLLHPSPQNNGRFSRYYNDDPKQKTRSIPPLKTFKSFAEVLMEEQGFSKGLRQLIAENLSTVERDSDKGRFLYYRNKFKEINGAKN